MRTELVTTLKRKATKILSQLENEKVPILVPPTTGLLPI